MVCIALGFLADLGLSCFPAGFLKLQGAWATVVWYCFIAWGFPCGARAPGPGAKYFAETWSRYL